MLDLKTCTCPRCWGLGHEPGNALATCTLCVGKGYVPDCQISPNFRFSELVRAHTGIPNDPGPGELEMLGVLCRELLEPVRAIVGPLQVTSGYRSQPLDVIADSGNTRWLREHSAHSIGAAADVYPLVTGRTLRDVMEVVRTTSGLAWDQAILEGGCAHLAVYSPYPIGANAQRHMLMVRERNPARDTDQHAAPWIYAKYDPSDPTQLERCR